MQRAGLAVVGLIGLHTFRQVLRERVLLVAGLFALLLVAAYWLIGQVAAGQEVKVVKDLGLAGGTVAGLLIAVLVGTGLVAGEVERGTIHTTLANPVRRPELILGQFVGLALVLAVALGVMAAALYGLLAWTALTAGIYVVGHFNADLRAMDEVTGPGAAAFLAACLSHILPDLAPLNVTAEVVHGQPVTAGYLALTAGYALVYLAALIVGAAFIFSRRDLP